VEKSLATFLRGRLSTKYMGHINMGLTAMYYKYRDACT